MIYFLQLQLETGGMHGAFPGLNLPGTNPYQNELFARLYAEHQSAALKAAASNLVSPSDTTSSVGTSQSSPHSNSMNGSLANIFAKDGMEEAHRRNAYLPNASSPLFCGLEGGMDLKSRDLAAAAAFANGMPSPQGLLRLSSNAFPGHGTFNDFGSMSTRPLAVRNQS